VSRGPTTVVIGAGLGGLSAAIHATRLGGRVEILEAQSRPGGKAGRVELDGVTVDTGPSVLTMPDVFEALWALGPDDVAVPLRQQGGGFVYRYATGETLDVSHRLVETLDNVQAAFGDRARHDLERFVAYAEGIWRRAAPYFVYGPAPTMGGLAQLGVTGLWDLTHIDPLRTMWSSICARVEDPRLRYLLARYATYNGSNVLTAPATLNCIAFVELALGGHGVQGGIRAMVQSLVRVAEHRGVRIRLRCPVEGLTVRDGRVVGVQTAQGWREADVVVANCDAALVHRWLPQTAGTVPVEPSMSGWNGIIRARRRADRPAHQVLFPPHYLEEFRDVFERDRPPEDPTVYVCAPEKAHGTQGWADEEPLFVMANAPAEPASGRRPERIHTRLEQRILERLRAMNAIDDDDRLVWRRTPSDLARQYPGSQGSIYGSSSNGMFAAFQRPSNRVAGVRGLYLASGSAHPGGGMPLAVLSGRQAIRCAEQDLERRTA
jgi:phytoene desaturase